MDAYEATLEKTGATALVNTPARPAALLYNLLLSLRRGGAGSLVAVLPAVSTVGVWIPIAGIVLYSLLRTLYGRRGPKRRGLPAPFDAQFLVFAAGLAGMALSTVLMLFFQSRFGSLFLYVGLVTALFMLGSFLGSTILAHCLRKRHEPRWLLPLLLAAHAGLVGVVALSPYGFPMAGYVALFALAGAVTGAYFPLGVHRLARAGVAATRSGADLESLDSLGGMIGGILTGVALLPLFGAPGTLIIVGALLAANLPPAFLAARRPSKPRETTAFDRWSRPLGYWLLGAAAFAVIASDLAAYGSQGASVQRLYEAARRMTGGAALGEKAASAGGEPIVYFETDEGYVFSSEAFAEDAAGYGGPITAALYTDKEGVLKDFVFLDWNETPAYVAKLDEWTETVKGRPLFVAGALNEIDAVSGATLTSVAVRRILAASGAGFARDVLGIAISEGQPAPRAGRGPDRDFLLLAGFIIAALLLHLRPHPWVRRALLAASVGILGFYANLQFSAQHVFSLLSLRLPALRLDGAFLMVIVIPIVVLFAGNIYCGYVCPFGALQELLGDLGAAVKGKGDVSKRVWRYGRAVKYVLLALLAFAFAFSRDFGVLASDPLTTAFSLSWDALVAGLIVASLVLSFFYRRFWCRNLCPVGAFLALLNGVCFLRRWLPKPRPADCDLGVRNSAELDCIRCDRCMPRAGDVDKHG